MNKSLINLSFVVASVLLIGCGSGGSTKDETAPVFDANAKYNYILNEGEEKIVPVNVKDDVTAKSNLKISTNDGTVISSSFKFVAPTVDADKNFIVTVTAVDEAGNGTSKKYTFTVKNINDETLKYSYVAPVGDKKFIDIGKNKDQTVLKVLESKLTWFDEYEGDSMSYSNAVNYCQNLGARIATRNELFNMINYKYVKTDSNDSIVDRDFTRSLNIHGVWAKNENGKVFYVNQANGVDVIETNASALHFPRCVKGQNDISSFTKSADIIKDTKTGLEWHGPIEDAKKFSDAQATCNSGGLTLPNINELRTIYNFGANMFISKITNDNNMTLWSETALAFENGKHYYMESKNAWDSSSEGAAAIQSDLDSIAHPFICVKRPQ